MRAFHPTWKPKIKKRLSQLQDLIKLEPVRHKEQSILDILRNSKKTVCPTCDAEIPDQIYEVHVEGCKSTIERFDGLSLSGTRLAFVLLPPDTWTLENVFKHFENMEDRISKMAGGRAVDMRRLSNIATLKPTTCHIGTRSWLGYVVFEFSNIHRVVLECPVEGNATYVLTGDWRQLVGETKFALRQRFPDRYRKIVHKGDWLTRVWEVLHESVFREPKA